MIVKIMKDNSGRDVWIHVEQYEEDFKIQRDFLCPHCNGQMVASDGEDEEGWYYELWCEHCNHPDRYRARE